MLALCQRAGLVRLGHVALDGTKVLANASKHKAVSYGRMGEAERKLEQEVAALLAQAAQIDAAEDAQYGQGRRGDELPAELTRRTTRLAKIREAKAALEAEAGAETAEVVAKAQTKLAERERKAKTTSRSRRAAHRRPRTPPASRPTPRRSGTSPTPNCGS